MYSPAQSMHFTVSVAPLHCVCLEYHMLTSFSIFKGNMYFYVDDTFHSPLHQGVLTLLQVCIYIFVIAGKALPIRWFVIIFHQLTFFKAQKR